jgi:hypothetical protein
VLTAFVSTRYDAHVGASARSSRVLRHLLTLIAALVVAPSFAHAQTTVTFDAPGTEINVDTTIQGGGYASVDFSTDDVLASKKSSNTSYTRRILLKFDTQNLIPANAVINSAKLYLVLKKADSSELRPLRAYRVTKSRRPTRRPTSATPSGPPIRST